MLLDLRSEIKGPGRIGSWGIKNTRNIVLEHTRGKEPDVDVTSELENVLVLPTIVMMSE